MPAFVVEDGSVVAGATSYVTVAYADDYLSVYPNIAEWTALLEANKEAYLMWATRLMDTYAVYEGTRVDESSALCWPRVGAYGKDNIPVAEDEIPEGLKNATTAVAFHLFTQGVDPAQQASPVGEFKSIKVDVIELKYRDRADLPSAALTFSKLFPRGISKVLGPIGRFPGQGSNRFIPIKKV